MEFYDDNRNITFKPGLRVHWYEYGRDMIIMKGGFGIVIDLKKTLFSPDGITYKSAESIMAFVLCDDGQMRNIPLIDIDIEDEWE